MSTQVEEALGVIDAAAKRAASIVRDLILFAEHRPPRRARCQVTEQIREVVAFEEARLESEGVSVRTNLEPVPDIWADHNHLQEVLLHVIQNAQHAMTDTIPLRRDAAGDAGSSYLTDLSARCGLGVRAA